MQLQHIVWPTSRTLLFMRRKVLPAWKAYKKPLSIFLKEIFTIADAKRGDIGNTSSLYARAFFETMNFDSITVAPYMGEDSVAPFLQYGGKWVILLALTSNKGSYDFQDLEIVESGSKLYQEVLQISQRWGSIENLMYVVGATKAESLVDIRKLVPDHFLLVPGVGAQGGSLKEVAKHGMNKDCGLLVNSSRGVIYASSEKDFAAKAGAQAHKLQQEMDLYLSEYL
jgi:orotidine-5'-phosphate decarboxylase